MQHVPSYNWFTSNVAIFETDQTWLLSCLIKQYVLLPGMEKGMRRATTYGWQSHPGSHA